MDNEKNKNVGENTSGEISEQNSEPQITAEDLIRRLKSNIKQNPNYSDTQGFAFDNDKHSDKEPEANDAAGDAPAEERPVIRRFRYKINKKSDVEETQTSSTSEKEEIFSEPAEKAVTPAAAEEPVAEKHVSNKTAIKELIASINESTAEEKNEERTDVNSAEEVAAKKEAVPSPDETALFGREKSDVSQKEINKFMKFVDPSTLKAESSITPPVVTDEVSLSLEDAVQKTNVFVPVKEEAKKTVVQNMFAEEETPTEAEQLSFNITDDDIQKSIKEAEAFIYEREHIDNPEEVINGTEGLQNENLLAESADDKEEYDQTDLWLASAFGDEDEVKNLYGEEKAQEIETKLDIDVKQYLGKRELPSISHLKEEFTSESQPKTIFKKYKKEHRASLIKILISILLLVVTFFFESAPTLGITLPDALDSEIYPVVHTLISLQLMLFCGVLIWKQLYTGVRYLIALKPIPESMTAIVFAVSAVYHIIICFIGMGAVGFNLHVFPIALCVLLTLIYDFFNLKREIFSFNIISSKRLKYTINHVDNEKADLENEAFGDYLTDKPSMFKIGKTKFVNGFFDRINSYPKNNSILNILLPLTVALSVVFCIVAGVIFDFKTGISTGYLVFMLSVPMSLFISFSYPFYRASKSAFENDSAIIGDISLAEYSNATTISFDDRDVFPSYGVKVRSIKVYGDSRIDKILYNASGIFGKVGGPLADVFDMATYELGHSDNVELIDVAKDGLEATVDGEHIYVGRASYMRANNFVPVSDPDDELIEESGESSIMFMVCGNEVAAKMYIQYMIDPDFEFTLKQLYKAGMCVGIKTFDPNIDDRMLSQRIKLTKYPVRILRCRGLDDMSESLEEVDSGIVSKGSSRSLLQTFVLCNRVLYVLRTSVIVKILSVILGVLLVTVAMLFNSVGSVTSVYVALYQLFWILPVYIISKIYI